ncbi:MAG: phytanoyl-CoA dioxygenase family protein [SAR202 cluster bacterium]|nr:phytanoyl-CoA dioxygenase family protein [SAR202 cluster bacterium]
MVLTKINHVNELKDQGYTILRNVLDPETDIQPLINENVQVLKSLIKSLNKQGKINNTYEGLEGSELFSKFIIDTGQEFFDAFNIFLNYGRTPTSNDQMYLHPEMFNLLRNPKLIDSLEQFLGSEIAVNPLHITRMKPPEKALPMDVQIHPDGSISKTNWHQDLWAFQDEANDTNVITVWVPMNESTENNGCLLVVPGSHKAGELNIHCKPSETKKGFKGIPDSIVSKNRVPLPVNPGDIIVMDVLTEHSALENKSDGLRWSYDLRYQVANQPAGQGIRKAWTVRSKSDPESEFKKFEQWKEYWEDIKEYEYKNGGSSWGTRYSLNDPMCV